MDVTDYIRFASALVFVVAAMGLFALVFRRLSSGGGIPGLADKRRLSIIEQKMIDPKNKAVLIRRDDVDHLVILSQNGSIVVETGITPPPEAVSPVTKSRTRDIPVESL